MNKIEELYKEYFHTEVGYDDKWKYNLFEVLNKKYLYLKRKYLVVGISFIVSIIIILSTVLIYNNYVTNRKNQYIKSILLSDSAIDFVIYENIGYLIEKYYLQNNSIFNESEELKESIKNSLEIYYFINIGNDNKIVKVNDKILNESVTNIINYLDEHFEDMIL